MYVAIRSLIFKETLYKGLLIFDSIIFGIILVIPGNYFNISKLLSKYLS